MKYLNWITATVFVVVYGALLAVYWSEIQSGRRLPLLFTFCALSIGLIAWAWQSVCWQRQRWHRQRSHTMTSAGEVEQREAHASDADRLSKWTIALCILATVMAVAALVTLRSANIPFGPRF